jgi:uncharacterized protein YjeT (DUF2065 family)
MASKRKKDEIHWLYVGLLGFFFLIAILLNVNSPIMGLPFGIIIVLIGISYFMMPPEWRQSFLFKHLKFNRKDIYATGLIITILGMLMILWVLYLDYMH